VKSNKTDANDAEAICEAMSRPSMRFVAVKTVEQQDLQAVHRVAQRGRSTHRGSSLRGHSSNPERLAALLTFENGAFEPKTARRSAKRDTKLH
jgi:hypothetical protein